MSSSGVLSLHFSDAPDLQVWDNAAFDDDGLEETTRPKDLPGGWAHSSKENLSPVLDNSPLKPQEEDGKIDREIKEIEREIARLSSRLHALKLEKADRKIKRRGRIVQAKFMDATRRRGLSLGPAEIHFGSRLRLLKEAGILTPVSSSRRVSCFWRIQEIDELSVIKERGKSASLSPKEKKQTGPKPKQEGAYTSKKPVKKDGRLVGLIQPRMLFGEGERPQKKVVKPPGRVVASRYNSGQGEARKRSLPDSNNEEGNKRQAQQEQPRRSDRDSGRLKKRWDIAAPVEDILPKIRRTLRRATETPRDSSTAKRVADLVGRLPYFGDD